MYFMLQVNSLKEFRIYFQFKGAATLAQIADPSLGAGALLVVAIGQGFALAFALYSVANISGS